MITYMQNSTKTVFTEFLVYFYYCLFHFMIITENNFVMLRRGSVIPGVKYPGYGTTFLVLRGEHLIEGRCCLLGLGTLKGNQAWVRCPYFWDILSLRSHRKIHYKVSSGQMNTSP